MKRSPDSNRTAPGHGITPRPSRAKEARAGRGAQTFLHQIRALTKQPSGSGFSGGSFARGRVHPLSGRTAQRVIVKARIVRFNAATGTKAVAAHLHYLVRDGVGVDGEDPKLFTAVGELDEREVRDWIKAGAEDRHQFRFIVSPEHADQLDLTQYTKDLMQQMASDLKTNLDWIAVTHHDTDNPHAHIVLRGVDDQGSDLVISRDYLSRGLRAMAQDLATRELGPRTAFEIDQQHTKQLTQDRSTPLDQQLEKDAARDPQHRIDLCKSAPRGFDLAQQYLAHELRFDPQFAFHFYDIDFCRQAEARHIRMGTGAICAIHASAGQLGGEAWRTAYQQYLTKYGET